VLFSDLRGFTSMSEKLQPEQVAEILQEYLTEMTQIVFRHGGTVDKYIGDCIMALWNAPFEDPHHAANAIKTGLEFQERTIQVSKKWEEKLGIVIRNGVGINTGEAVVGTMGSKQRLEYTAIGDTINLGARLESITKDYGASIIISESTYDYVHGQFLTRELGAVTVKGKTQPVKIFHVLAEDLRKYPRAVIEAAATMTALDSERAVAVQVTDLSEGGLAVQGEFPPDWDKGKAVQIRCDGGGLTKPVVADGTIVWRRDDHAGVSFSGLSHESGSTVADYVSTHPRA
jgi:class 3 adenylate cyclase